jgi:3-methylcrotonyl-CoA carboxylase alpha subunit
MRRVDRPEEFQDALDAAKREAGSAFGDDRMLIEKYLVRPRHIEIQIFADSAGNVVHLFERDCSVQRRHQKVLEEAPAPGLSPERREAMAAAAVAAAEAIGYVGAGTVEFIVAEDGTFYFMEMNTRLQVEHPVTELTTGFDLVEWQLRVAAGERLPRSQAEIAALGHAIEARLYAEDPSRDFLPATGRLRRLVLPAETLSVRVDSGVAEGDEIGVHYDPMIAKIIARGYDRASALRRLGRALAETRVAGVVTNLDLLGAIVRHPAFAEGGVDTGFIERHKAELIPAATAPPDETLAMAALAVLLERRETAAVTAAAGPDPHSPWHEVGGWRLNGDAQYGLRFHSLDDGSERGVTVHFRGRGFRLDLSGGSMTAEVDRGEGGAIRAFLDGRRTVADATKSGDRLTVFLRGRSWRFSLIDPLAAAAQAEAGAGRMVAPMPGRIVAVHVKAGDRVRRGQPLVALEAMKMEHGVAAPADGIVEAVHFTLGDLVDEGAELLSLTAEEGSGS